MHYTFSYGMGPKAHPFYFRALMLLTPQDSCLNSAAPEVTIDIYAVTTLSRCESWGISATSALPISREDVAAGDGALQTWMEF